MAGRKSSGYIFSCINLPFWAIFQLNFEELATILMVKMHSCSLACFKKHKEVPCKVPSPPSEKTVPVALPKRSCQVDEESWVLKKEQLKYLVDAHEIRDALKNEELRNLICAIDCSEDPEDELEKAMKAPSFREFAEKILSIVSPIG